MVDEIDPGSGRPDSLFLNLDNAGGLVLREHQARGEGVEGLKCRKVCGRVWGKCLRTIGWRSGLKALWFLWRGWDEK